ncbi:hypothetical protein ABK040_015967 [Willaertia magna]
MKKFITVSSIDVERLFGLYRFEKIKRKAAKLDLLSIKVQESFRKNIEKDQPLDLQQLIKRKYKSKVDLDLKEFVLNEIDILFDDIFENKEVNDEVRSNCENNNEKFIPNSIEDILKSVDKSISLEAEKLFDEFIEISNCQNENQILNENNKEFILNSIEDILKSVDESISLEAEELFGEFLEISNFQNENQISNKNIQNLLDKVFNSTTLLTIETFYHQIKKITDIININHLLQFVNSDPTYYYKPTFKNAMAGYIGKITLL